MEKTSMCCKPHNTSSTKGAKACIHHNHGKLCHAHTTTATKLTHKETAVHAMARSPWELTRYGACRHCGSHW